MGKADDTGSGGDGGAPGDDASVEPLGPVPFGPFDTLSESGLYVDMAAKTLRPDLLEFEPEFELWSDRADKRRWIWIPPGRRINTSSMSRWQVPVGTTVWKEFSDPVTGRRLETRIVQRLPRGACANPPCFYLASHRSPHHPSASPRAITPPARSGTG